MKLKKCSFVIVLSLFSFIVLGPCSWCVDLDTLRKALEAEIAGSGAEVSLAFKDLQTGETLFIGEKDMVHAASTMKVPVLIEVFKQAEDGKFRLDDRIVIKNEFHSIVDGSPFSLNKEDDSDPEIYGLIGTSLTIRELAELHDRRQQQPGHQHIDRARQAGQRDVHFGALGHPKAAGFEGC